MIRISHKHKAIFCHIPKCGGTSVERVLSDWERIDHTKVGRLAFPDRFIGMGQYIYDNLPDYFVFTIVRNPYDRYASGLNHVNKYGSRWNKYWAHEHLYATQTETLGDLVPDYIMKLENINKEWNLIRSKFGVSNLPHVNRTRQRVLTDEQVTFVNIKYAIDFINFRYDKK